MKIKPCPFCGGKAEAELLWSGIANDGQYFVSAKVECKQCDIRMFGSSYYTDKEKN